MDESWLEWTSNRSGSGLCLEIALPLCLRQDRNRRNQPGGSIRNQSQVTSPCDKRRQHIYLVFPVRGDDSHFGGWFVKEDKSPSKREESSWALALGIQREKGSVRGQGENNFRRSMTDTLVAPAGRDMCTAGSRIPRAFDDTVSRRLSISLCLLHVCLLGAAPNNSWGNPKIGRGAKTLGHRVPLLRQQQELEKENQMAAKEKNKVDQSWKPIAERNWTEWIALTFRCDPPFLRQSRNLTKNFPTCTFRLPSAIVFPRVSGHFCTSKIQLTVFFIKIKLTSLRGV